MRRCIDLTWWRLDLTWQCLNLTQHCLDLMQWRLDLMWWRIDLMQCRIDFLQWHINFSWRCIDLSRWLHQWHQIGKHITVKSNLVEPDSGKCIAFWQGACVLPAVLTAGSTGSLEGSYGYLIVEFAIFWRGHIVPFSFLNLLVVSKWQRCHISFQLRRRCFLSSKGITFYSI